MEVHLDFALRRWCGRDPISLFTWNWFLFVNKWVTVIRYIHTCVSYYSYVVGEFWQFYLSRRDNRHMVAEKPNYIDPAFPGQPFKSFCGRDQRWCSGVPVEVEGISSSPTRSSDIVHLCFNSPLFILVFSLQWLHFLRRRRRLTPLVLLGYLLRTSILFFLLIILLSRPSPLSATTARAPSESASMWMSTSSTSGSLTPRMGCMSITTRWTSRLSYARLAPCPMEQHAAKSATFWRVCTCRTAAGLGRIVTPAGRPDVSPDACVFFSYILCRHLLVCSCLARLRS